MCLCLCACVGECGHLLSVLPDCVFSMRCAHALYNIQDNLFIICTRICLLASVCMSPLIFSHSFGALSWHGVGPSLPGQHILSHIIRIPRVRATICCRCVDVAYYVYAIRVSLHRQYTSSLFVYISSIIY